MAQGIQDEACVQCGVKDLCTSPELTSTTETDDVSGSSSSVTIFLQSRGNCQHPETDKKSRKRLAEARRWRGLPGRQKTWELRRRV